MTTAIRKIFIISKVKFFNILKSPQLLSSLLLSIGFCYLMSEYVPEEQLILQPLFIINMGIIFSTIMGGIMMTSLPLAADKENNILRVLMVSTISPSQYLLGGVLPTFLFIFLTNGIIGIFWLPESIPLSLFMIVTSLGTLISLIIGCIIGFYSSNQMIASSTCIPIIFIFALIPIFKTINDDFEIYSKYLYSSQIMDYLLNVHTNDEAIPKLETLLVLGITLFFAILIAFYGYRKNRFD